MSWHAPPTVLHRYARQPGSFDEVTASSIEGHLLSCAACRAEVSKAVPPAALEASWAGIVDRIDRPRPGPVERMLSVLGVRESTARLIGATRPLQTAWLVATAAVVGLVVGLARTADDPGLYLAVAPVVPLGLVAVAFAAGAEPAGDIGRATPLTGAALVVRRSLAVLAASLVALGAGALLLPTIELGTAAWVLPGLGLALGALAAATWVRIEVAAAAAALVWLVALEAAHLISGPGLPLAQLAPLTLPGQLVSLAAIGAASVALGARRDAYGGMMLP